MIAFHYWQKPLPFLILALALELKAEIAEPRPVLANDESISAVNEPSLADIAGARDGWFLGVGTQTLTQMLDERVQTTWLPRLWLNFPLFYPLSLRSTFSRSDEAGLTQYGAFLQWHVYERFAWPAISIRAGRNFLQVQQEATFSSNSADLLASWGFRFLSAYAGLGQSWQKSSDREGASRQAFASSRFAGLHWQVKPAALALSYEAKIIGGIRSVAAKIEILL